MTVFPFPWDQMNLRTKRAKVAQRQGLLPHIQHMVFSFLWGQLTRVAP
jgi:hypothetical protein